MDRLRPARPIHGTERIARAQSAKLGMKPRSSRTCISPMRRTGTTRPVESVSVAPNTVSSMKMPSAWWRRARCRKSARIAFDASNHWCRGMYSSDVPPQRRTEERAWW